MVGHHNLIPFFLSPSFSTSIISSQPIQKAPQERAREEGGEGKEKKEDDSDPDLHPLILSSHPPGRLEGIGGGEGKGGVSR